MGFSMQANSGTISTVVWGQYVYWYGTARTNTEEKTDRQTFQWGVTFDLRDLGCGYICCQGNQYTWPVQDGVWSVESGSSVRRQH